MARVKQMAKRSRPLSGSPATSARKSRISAEASVGPSTGQEHKKSRFKPGTVALREIRKYQRSGHLLIPAAPFVRTVKEISQFYSEVVTRWEAKAMVALQEAVEDYIVSMFSDAMLCAVHAKRVTLMKKDIELARRLGVKGRPW